MTETLDEYRAARDKLDATLVDVASRRARDLACRAGCAACCEVSLEVSAVEAAAIRAALLTLPPSAREALRAREPGTRCVMLGDDDRCTIYAARPFVCRTQGLPLLYPTDVVPEATVRLRTSRGDVVACPLNFVGAPPRGEDLIDAERVDVLLGVVDHRFRAGAAATRTPLLALARED